MILEDKQEQELGSWELIQFGIYRIIQGPHTGERVMAFRGSQTALTFLQDLTIALHSPLIRATIKNAAAAARDSGVDWVCGHSLGGFIAECVCARTGIGGASFQAPGPWAPIRRYSYVRGNKYANRPFEVHLTRSDPVSKLGIVTPRFSHIGEPDWHSHSELHSISAIRKHIESKHPLN